MVDKCSLDDYNLYCLLPSPDTFSETNGSARHPIDEANDSSFRYAPLRHCMRMLKAVQCISLE